MFPRALATTALGNYGMSSTLFEVFISESRRHQRAPCHISWERGAALRVRFPPVFLQQVMFFQLVAQLVVGQVEIDGRVPLIVFIGLERLFQQVFLDPA